MRLNELVAQIRRTRTIAAEPQEIWDVLADFGAISSWTDTVDHSCLLSPESQDVGVDTSRRVQVGRKTLVERITEFDPPTALRYDVEGYPRWLKVNSHWTLTRSGSTTAVTLVITVDVSAGPLRWVGERVVARASDKWPDAMLAGLANRVENNRV